MIYFMYAVFAIISLLFTLFVWVFSIPLALLANKDGNLPGFLYYLQTFDASLDAGWKDGYDGFDPNDPLWKNRAKWLRRNPSYGVDYWLLGMHFDPTEWTVEKFDTNWFIATHNGGLFNRCYFGPKGQMKLGWKAWNYFLNKFDEKGNPVWDTKPFGPEWRVPFCFSINPFKRDTTTAS